MARAARRVTGRFLRSEAIAEALVDGRPVVALETSVIGQGLPPPRNAECVERMNAAIAARGALSAWIGVIHGRVTVGLTLGRAAALHGAGSLGEGRAARPAACVATGALGATSVSATIGPRTEPGSSWARPEGSVVCIRAAGTCPRICSSSPGHRCCSSARDPSRSSTRSPPRSASTSSASSSWATEPTASRSSWRRRAGSISSIRWGRRRRRPTWLGPWASSSCGQPSSCATRCRPGTRWMPRRWPPRRAHAGTRRARGRARQGRHAVPARLHRRAHLRRELGSEPRIARVQRCARRRGGRASWPTFPPSGARSS